MWAEKFLSLFLTLDAIAMGKRVPVDIYPCSHFILREKSQAREIARQSSRERKEEEERNRAISTVLAWQLLSLALYSLAFNSLPRAKKRELVGPLHFQVPWTLTGNENYRQQNRLFIFFPQILLLHNFYSLQCTQNGREKLRIILQSWPNHHIFLRLPLKLEDLKLKQSVHCTRMRHIFINQNKH